MPELAVAIKSIPLGTQGMGAEAWSLQVVVNGKTLTSLAEHEALSFEEEWSQRVINSVCGEYLIIHCEFFTFVVSKRSGNISLFKATIRGPNGVWSEETPIYKSESTHLNGENKRHYYLQYPFISDSSFWPVFSSFHEMRLAQIQCAKNT